MSTLGIFIVLIGGCTMDSANMIYPVAIITVGVLMIVLDKMKRAVHQRIHNSKNISIV